ncbi:hypothetical protein Q7C_2553 [Methylophaga frappieri]|uniref:Iron uptake protein n=1 Tax=Methylophaga frappieri (strain ATCC BAA-2434 / DSM 25690 / JAM7) TaxID=754477 RepID=I1YL81_METFJ|nr:hypothetical protein Q7C_2553 [Methylophaga frappieri]
MKAVLSRHQEQAILGSRILVAVFGGYIFCWGFIALTVAACYAAGMAFHDGEQLGSILSFLIYPAVFLWAFATRRVGLVAAVLVGGGALMTVTASLIQMLMTGGMT